MTFMTGSFVVANGRTFAKELVFVLFMHAFLMTWNLHLVFSLKHGSRVHQWVGILRSHLSNAKLGYVQLESNPFHQQNSRYY